MQSYMYQVEMERMKDVPTPEGQQPKSAVQIVAEVLNKCPPGEVNQSTFLANVGLQSRSAKNKGHTAVVVAQVHDLEEKLERSEQQTKALREEMSAMKKMSEASQAAQVACDKEYALMSEKVAQLMALMGAKATGS